jgi:hypothetical protein
MLTARTYSISIALDWRVLYDRIWSPTFFPKWAAGLAESDLRADGDHWVADGPDGPVRIRFTPRNELGVMDHWVELGDGSTVHVPLRVVENGDGAEVMLTLYRQPDMNDERFAGDAKLILRDLRALKELIEKEAGERSRQSLPGVGN